MELLLEEVFKLSGVPTHTFVYPSEYTQLLVSLRTPGRGLVVEGPSGIGKTTSVTKALEELGLNDKALKLTARKKDDRSLIEELPSIGSIGTVIIDDFHRLQDHVKELIADFMKTLADEENTESKVVIIGINRAGDSLVKFARDLNNRIDTIRFEANPEHKVMELIYKGEEKLNIFINTKEEIAKESCGSFHIAQMLCHRSCLLEAITQQCNNPTTLCVSIESVKEHVLADLSRAFFEVAKKFATGTKLRREGRAPYLHLLNWLALSNEWSLAVDQALIQHQEQKGSVGQIIDKGYLVKFLSDNPELGEVLHFDSHTRILSAEDPKFIYYIRNLLWSKFAKQVGYITLDFKSQYDFALSFSGEDRNLAEAIYNKLTTCEIEVFYDKNEQHRILAVDVEEYLGPIYKTEAKYIIVLLSKTYPKKIWTKFESDQFKSRFGDEAIIPIWFSDNNPSPFDSSYKVGGITYDLSTDFDTQVNRIAELLMLKIGEDRKCCEVAATVDNIEDYEY